MYDICLVKVHICLKYIDIFPVNAYWSVIARYRQSQMSDFFLTWKQ